MRHSADIMSKLILSVLLVLLVSGLTTGSVIAAELKVEVGPPTTLVTYPSAINTDSVTCSRTGYVAVFYPREVAPSNGRKMRVSTDAGLTWGPEIYAPDHGGGAQEIGLRDGGVLKVGGDTYAVGGDYYRMNMFIMPDDFAYNDNGWKVNHGSFTSTIYVPNSQSIADIIFPGVSKGPIIQIPDGYSGDGVKPGDLLMPMHGAFTGDKWVRSYLVHSTDLGHTWSYRGSIAYLPKDPHPQTSGQWLGMAEPTIALLPNGQLLAVIRSNGDPAGRPEGQFKPLYTAWSDDMGLTWTNPNIAAVDSGETHSYLESNSPTLAVLENGVVAVSYGRPGFHIAFSTDNGHTWGDIVHLSELLTDTTDPTDIEITGQFDMVKAGPNKLVAVGSDNNGHLKVWPITVDLDVPPAAAPPPLGGDFDLDGDVDGVDFGIWQSNYPTASGASLGDGDADGDGDVDAVDFTIWQANFPTAAPAPVAGGAAVP